MTPQIASAASSRPADLSSSQLDMRSACSPPAEHPLSPCTASQTYAERRSCWRHTRFTPALPVAHTFICSAAGNAHTKVPFCQRHTRSAHALPVVHRLHALHSQPGIRRTSFPLAAHAFYTSTASSTLTSYSYCICVSSNTVTCALCCSRIRS